MMKVIINYVKGELSHFGVGTKFGMVRQTNHCTMENKEEKKRGPKDRDYVNKSEKHEVKYEPKRKTPAKKFGDKN
ncbi:hypothetical protein [Chryseolinea sp. H1M3-3]|jgi:hypothetical protein|uniref:hypothetical protein n=1 Tax=Chryseolinea sp. H1M3-3 TaxID=3034144 RepID=UPI0023EBFAA5|nr:hypothetical protein [Chryseolinea sp. H1M3-3]